MSYLIVYLINYSEAVKQSTPQVCVSTSQCAGSVYTFQTECIMSESRGWMANHKNVESNIDEGAVNNSEAA